MKSSLRACGLYPYILIFFYIYNIGFFILPSFFKTRLIIGLLGVFYYWGKHVFHVKIRNIIYIYLFFLLYSGFVSVCNAQFDTWFIVYVVRNILYLLGAVYVVDVLIHRYNISFNRLLYLILSVILFNNIVSFIGIIFPPLQKLIVEFQGLSDVQLIQTMMEGHGRSIGFGDGNFFFGGIFSGLGLIITVYLRRIGYIKTILSVCFFVTLLITGVFLARTTLIGLISILFLFVGRNEYKRRCLFFYLNALIVVSVVIMCIFFFAKDVINIEWAFEIVISYFEKNSFETGSTNHLKEMFVFPETLKTYIVGDALFEEASGAYYMQTDVGYLRLLFYWGIGGLILFWIFQFYLYWYVYVLSNRDRMVLPLLWIILSFILVLNVKGFCDANYIGFLFLGYYSCRFRSYEYCVSNQ